MTAENCEKYEDPRITRTRQLLVDSLLRVVSTKPFDSVTVQDITKDATVNRATFYAHFKDKYELVSYAMGKQAHNFLRASFHPDSELSAESLSKLLTLVIEYLNQSPCTQHGEARAPESTFDQFQSLFEDALAHNVQGVISYWFDTQLHGMDVDKTDIASDASIGSTIISSAIIGAAKHWQQLKPKPDITVYSNSVISVLLRGLHSIAPFVDSSSAARSGNAV
jgi:AcrR family transcriptional regulator